ncbi:MAG: TRAP transporter small permease [Clostridiales bacterium]|nr:TRAP transporter small permease [Clostridiales bacterium]
MKKIVNVYNKFEEIFLVILLLVMVVLIFVQVVMRYCFNSSLSWSEELARILFIWVSWIGISLGQKKGEHIKITMVTDKLKGNAKKAILVLSDICTLAILGILCVKGTEVVMHIMGLGAAMPATGCPKWIVYSAVPLSCMLMAIRVIKDLVITLKDKQQQEVA